MKLLYIAYSCAPGKGSEDKIGWRVPLAAAKTNQVFVITKEEHRSEIEAYCMAHELPAVRFYYADIPAAAKTVFRGAAYSLRLNLWHRQALVLAEELCRREGIQIIHQITPVEFRSIGDYGRISGVKFLCGPVGGGEYIPSALWRYAGRHLPLELARRILNQLSRRRLKTSGILGRCDGLLFANRETAAWLAPVLEDGTSLGICTEIGIGAEEITRKNRHLEDCIFLVAGRLIYRKGHKLLLDALAALPGEPQWRCCIVGDGPEKDRLKRHCEKLGLARRVEFSGRVPHSRMKEIYETAQVLVLPSLRETTGSVVLEAMAKGLPVVAMNRFGGAALVRPETGWQFCPHRQSLSEVLREVLSHPEEVIARGENAAAAAKEYTWEKKCAYYQQLYRQLLSGEE